MSLFGNPQSTSPLFQTTPSKSLFGTGNPPITTGPSLFSSITGGNPAGPTTGLFGYPQSVGFNPQPSNPTPNTSLFNPQNPPNSLFATGSGQNTTGGLFNSGQNTGGLFGGGQNNSGLFGTNPTASQTSLFGTGNTAQPSLFGTNPSQPSPFGLNPSQPSLFSGSSFGTNSTGLFNQPASAPSLFGNNPGTSMISNPGQGLFAQPAPGGMFSGAPQQPLPVMTYTQYPGYKNKVIDSLNQTDKENLFRLRTEIDQNDGHLTQADNTLEKITKIKSDLKLRLLDLFTYARKVQTSEKRCKASLDIVKKFQANINLFIKESIKIFDRCETADSYNQIETPGVFLSDMLIHCEERLKSIEESFKEIQELLQIEQKNSEFILLVKTISMMQEKFEIISSVAFDVHKRVEEVVNRYSSTFGIEVSEGKKDVKMREVPKPKKFSTLSDLIAVRPSVFTSLFH